MKNETNVRNEGFVKEEGGFVMVWHIVCAAGMAVLAAVMLAQGRRGGARRMAAVPLGVAFLEGMLAGAVPPLAMPGLTALLLALYAAIVICCVAALRRDAAVAAVKRERRRRLSKQLRCALYPLQAVAARADGAAAWERADCA